MTPVIFFRATSLNIMFTVKGEGPAASDALRILPVQEINYKMELVHIMFRSYRQIKVSMISAAH
jgi:hypothetical protein